MICEHALAANIARNDLLIAIGGGVCSDLVTMAASFIRRGVRHIRIPTTLIGQIDAAIGIKGVVNFHSKKSFLGCFYAPTDVSIDPSMLRSLQKDAIRYGLAEILKIGIVLDKYLYHLVDQFGIELIDSNFQANDIASGEILERAITGMLNQLKTNLYEDKTLERLVDFGHTFSPSLEFASKFEIPHDHAVAIDIALSASIASELDVLNRSDRDHIITLLGRLGLQTNSPLLTWPLCRESLATASMHRGGRPNLVIPTSIGCGDFIRTELEISDAVIRRALETLNAATTQPETSSSVLAHA